jgi:hypothetical protein
MKLSFSTSLFVLGLSVEWTYGAPGDLIATVNLPVQGSGVSVANNCEGLIFYTNVNDHSLYMTDKYGTDLSNVDIGFDIDEIAWDESRQVLWGQLHDSNPVAVYKIDPALGTAIFAFKSTTNSIGTFRDGIAYDDTDDTLWLSGDVS